MPYSSSLEAIVAEFYSTMDDIFEVIDETIANATESSSDSEAEGEAIPTPPPSSSASFKGKDGFDVVPAASAPSGPESEVDPTPSSSEVEEGDEHRDEDNTLFHGKVLHGGAEKAYPNMNASMKSRAGLTREKKTHDGAR